MDAKGKDGIRSEIEMLDFLRILGTGHSFDEVEDSAQLERQSIRFNFLRISRDIIAVYEST